MVPLASSLRALTARPPSSSSSTSGLLPFLIPSLHCKPHPASQIRQASILGSLSDNPGAYNKRIRRGRGPASGKGKTSGRGHKGQKQHGKVPAGFTGGQTPLAVVKGLRGFENQFSVDMTPINLDRIQSWIDQGRIDTSRPITLKELQESRCTHGIKDGVKLLARATTPFTHPINITVSRASAAAIAAVEAAGGTVQTRYYTRPSIRRILRNESHPTLSLMSESSSTTSPQSTSSMTSTPASAADTHALNAATEEPGATTSDAAAITVQAEEEEAPRSPSSQSPSPSPSPSPTSAPISTSPTAPSIFHSLPPPQTYRYRLPDPTSRKDLEYYRDRAHRGYLAYQVEEGAGPSLFFKTPSQTVGAGKEARGRMVKKGAKKGEGRGESRLF